MRYIGKLALGGLSTLALTACGGSSAGSSTNAAANFTSKASAVCSGVNSQIAALPAIKTSAQALKVGTQELAITAPAITKLKAISAGADKQAQFAKWTATLSQSQTVNSQLLVALKSGQQAKFTSLAAQSKALNSKGNGLAKSLGLSACSQDVQPGSANSTSSST